MKRSAMPPRLRRSSPMRRERGMVLACALLLMLVAMIAAVAVARTGLAAGAAVRDERDRLLARAAAETALRDAERDIDGAGPPARSAWFGAAGVAAWPAGCGRGAFDRGLCADAEPAAWRALDLSAADNPALAAYGELTGAPFASGGLLPARAPVYLIERLAAGAQPGVLYRITAAGFGTRAATLVVLQALYRTAPPGAPPQPALPVGRIGMREIVNWRALLAQARS